MKDYHIHPGYSLDAEGSLEDYIKIAIKLNYKEIGFTPHLEISKKRKETDDYVRLNNKIVDMRSDWLSYYFAEIERLRKRYKEIKIKAGIEVGYYPEEEEEIREIIKKYPFDYILGAVHSLDAISITESKENEKLIKNFPDVNIYLERYFQLLKKAIESKIFTHIAHIDMYKKFGYKFFGDRIKEKGLKYLKEILKLIKKNNISLEINTSGLRQPFKEIYPSEEIIKLSKKIGIKKFIIGSDTHYLKDFGDYIHWGYLMSKKYKLKIGL
ncbi:MAG: histidinol-phosphatase [candidate division WOR-3 bacterium]|nr:histidinol-phosphatase [candidate division WOR-3 bacterium]